MPGRLLGDPPGEGSDEALARPQVAPLRIRLFRAVNGSSWRLPATVRVISGPVAAAAAVAPLSGEPSKSVKAILSGARTRQWLTRQDQLLPQRRTSNNRVRLVLANSHYAAVAKVDLPCIAASIPAYSTAASMGLGTNPSIPASS